MCFSLFPMFLAFLSFGFLYFCSDVVWDFLLDLLISSLYIFGMFELFFFVPPNCSSFLWGVDGWGLREY